LGDEASGGVGEHRGATTKLEMAMASLKGHQRRLAPVRSLWWRKRPKWHTTVGLEEDVATVGSRLQGSTLSGR
jgi:hypothetical protein